VCVFVCVRVIQPFLIPCYKMFAFLTSLFPPVQRVWVDYSLYLSVCVCVYLCDTIHTVDVSWRMCVSPSVSGRKSVHATLSLISRRGARGADGAVER